MKNIASIWEELQREGKSKAELAERLYRGLGVSAIGIRAGYIPHEETLELLIEIPRDWAGDALIPHLAGDGA